MDRIAIIYWSGTGNTEAMANAIFDGTKQGDAEVKLFSVSDIDATEAFQYDKLILGCPSMGSEVLEESEFEPFYEKLKEKLEGKKVALFGSYGWGDGEWMRDWQQSVTEAKAVLFKEGLTVNEIPGDTDLAECMNFGKEFAAF